MKRTLVRIVTLLVVVAVVGGLVASKMASNSQGASQKDGKSGPKEVLVTTWSIEPETITRAIATIGTLRPDESVAIKNEVPGKVVDIGFEEGERVERGERLLQIRQDELRAELEIKRREKQLVETQVERQRQVLKQGGISQQEFDVTKNRLDVLEAEMQRIRAEIDKRTVRAPFDGRVGLREISPGAILTQGTMVAELVKTHPIELEFTVPERYARQIERETAVRFRVHGSDRIHEATIHAIDPRIESGSRVLRVRARTDNSKRELRPGAYAQVRVQLGTIENALTVPSVAVITSGDRRTVWVSEDGTAQKQTVETGIRTENRVQITEGLEAGDTVVVTGRQNVQPGAKLKVDTSEDAMDVEAIQPDPDKQGMRNKWFSEEPLESKGRESPETSNSTNDSNDTSTPSTDETDGEEE
jgi:membrane fusion protein (multidrug efflux system)